MMREMKTRVYNYGGVFDHAVGYSSKGKTGIEAMANFYLLSSHVNLVEQAGNELAGAKIWETAWLPLWIWNCSRQRMQL